MKVPRPLIFTFSCAVMAALVLACGNGLALPAGPTGTRVPVLAPGAPAAPTIATLESAAGVPTEAPPTSVPTEPSAGVLVPLEAATPTPPATPEATATPAPADAIEFNPAELVQGGAAVVYFNQPATAATLTFGGKQYPMLFDGIRWWAMIGIGAFAEPGQAPVTVVYNPTDGSAQTTAEGGIAIVARDFPVENIDLDAETSALLDPAIVNNEEAFRATIFAGYTTTRLWDGPFLAPCDAPIGDVYGIARSYNGGPVTSYHRGTDFTGNTGDPVYAAAAGRVVFAGQLQVRGNAIIIDHGAGVFTTYNHLSAIDVSEGDTVSARQVIGQVGSTGLVTGPHLHWEVVVRGIEVDGQLWLAGSVGQ